MPQGLPPFTIKPTPWIVVKLDAPICQVCGAPATRLLVNKDTQEQRPACEAHWGELFEATIYD